MSAKTPQRLARVLGANIAYRRQLMKMSQAELSEKLDIAPDVMSRVENGHITPRFGRIELIASLLGCSVADLFQESANDTSSKAVVIAELISPLSSTKQEELISLIAQLVHILRDSE